MKKHFGAALRDAVMKTRLSVSDIALDIGISRGELYKMFDAPDMERMSVAVARKVVTYYPALEPFLYAEHAAPRHTRPASRRRR